MTMSITSITSRLSPTLQLRSYNNVHHFHPQCHHVFHMHYSVDPITMFITSIKISITSISCITASVLKQCPSLPSPSPSRVSHALQLHAYNYVRHHRHHVYHMHYSFDPITMSITIAITSVRCITVSFL